MRYLTSFVLTAKAKFFEIMTRRALKKEFGTQSGEIKFRCIKSCLKTGSYESSIIKLKSAQLRTRSSTEKEFFAAEILWLNKRQKDWDALKLEQAQ